MAFREQLDSVNSASLFLGWGAAVESAMDAAANSLNSASSGADPDIVMGRFVELCDIEELMSLPGFKRTYSKRLDSSLRPQLGTWAYDVNFSYKARVRQNRLKTTLPAQADIRVQGIRRGKSGRKPFISAIGGMVNDEPWMLHRAKATAMIKRRAKNFHVVGGDGIPVPVHVYQGPGPNHWDYLASAADGDRSNNLLSLPDLDDIPGFVRAQLEPDPSA